MNFFKYYIREKSLWYHRLAFKLLFEDINRTKDDYPPEKKQWLDSLPSSFSTPIHWKEEFTSQLQYSSLISKVEQQKKDWKEYYDKWQSEQPNSIPFDRFVWALECVNSRAFSGVFEGSTAAERKSLVAFTAILSLAWPTLQLGTVDQSISAFLVVCLSILVRDVIMSKVAQLKRYVVCPVIDLFNHKSTALAGLTDLFQSIIIIPVI